MVIQRVAHARITDVAHRAGKRKNGKQCAGFLLKQTRFPFFQQKRFLVFSGEKSVAILFPQILQHTQVRVGMIEPPAQRAGKNKPVIPS